MAGKVNPVTYAEETLGVHRVYEEVVAKRNELDDILGELSDKRDKRRVIEQGISDREMDIVSDERGKHPDMSEAGMTRHLKTVFAKDPLIAPLRQQLLELNNDIDGLEFDKAMAEYDIKIGLARMNELGGYLQYLAVAKLAAIPPNPLGG